ncbi:hypothetical protein [Ruegeria sp. HKCCD6428]|uniref:hypothetical protein n=1 Tax=Ruegeria sp. HKCCD6428 TaxID=2683002 RepID=UPI0014908E0B|nr:hypothetical protein [Ruegeria sp. HKCCD6428]NOC83832.1 hypothetical protein [Ruegeria sp. HKCCD6428]
MTILTDFVNIYESSDAGSGDPEKTFWQIRVGSKFFLTNNHHMAATARLAIQTSRAVQVTYDDDTISQLRIDYEYVCVEKKFVRCSSESPTGGDELQKVCDTMRLAPCEPNTNRDLTED